MTEQDIPYTGFLKLLSVWETETSLTPRSHPVLSSCTLLFSFPKIWWRRVTISLWRIPLSPYQEVWEKYQEHDLPLLRLRAAVTEERLISSQQGPLQTVDGPLQLGQIFLNSQYSAVVLRNVQILRSEETMSTSSLSSGMTQAKEFHLCNPTASPKQSPSRQKPSESGLGAMFSCCSPWLHTDLNVVCLQLAISSPQKELPVLPQGRLQRLSAYLPATPACMLLTLWVPRCVLLTQPCPLLAVQARLFQLIVHALLLPFQ